MPRTTWTACMTLACGWVAAQPVTNLPAFDSVSIKRNDVGGGSSEWYSRTSYLVMKNQTLQRLVSIAYGLPDDRISGGPKWVASDHFDIEGRAAGPAKDPDLLLMLQHALGERFQLATHRENRNIDGYALVPIKNGIKISPDETPGKPKWNSNRGKIVAERVPIAKITESLTRILGKPVVDMTGAPGVYSFTLEWNVDPPRPGASDAAPPETPSGPTLFDVVAQQLGLKLENKKIPAEILIIDKAEKPAEN